MNEAHASTFAHYFTMLEASQETATDIGRLLANVLRAFGKNEFM